MPTNSNNETISAHDEGEDLPRMGGSERESINLDCYDAGLLSDYGGGNVEWWQDYIRAELGHAHDHYQAQFDALSAAPQSDGWRPIAEAPKDGTLFLCWVSAVRYGETEDGQQYQEDASQVDFCNWRTQADIPDCGWFDPCCGQIADQQRVTHWMPLPTPPKKPEGEKP